MKRTALAGVLLGLAMAAAVQVPSATAANTDTNTYWYHGLGDGTDSDGYFHPFNEWVQDCCTVSWSSVSLFAYGRGFIRGTNGYSQHLHFDYTKSSGMPADCKFYTENAAPHYHYHFHHSPC